MVFHSSVLANIYSIDVGTMIFRAEASLDKIVPVFIYMVDEPSIVPRKSELPNKVSGS